MKSRLTSNSNRANSYLYVIYTFLAVGLFLSATFPLCLKNINLCILKISINTSCCPQTVEVLKSLKNFLRNCAFGNACFSVLKPGSNISAHYGPCNVRIRCHLGKLRNVLVYEQDQENLQTIVKIFYFFLPIKIYLVRLLN